MTTTTTKYQFVPSSPASDPPSLTGTVMTKFPYVIAHSTHVRGIGEFRDGVEYCRVKVTLATGISREECEAINLGWRDWRSIDPAEYADREDEGILYVPKAGEMLYHLRERPEWAREM